MTAFNPHDPSTWPLNLNAHEVSQIYRRSLSGLRKAVQRKCLSIPYPYKTHPYLWRRSDVLRDVEGARGTSWRVAS